MWIETVVYASGNRAIFNEQGLFIIEAIKTIRGKPFDKTRVCHPGETEGFVCNVSLDQIKAEIIKSGKHILNQDKG